MAENILFTLVDEYGNSLEKFKLQGSFAFYYNYPNKEPMLALKGLLKSGIAYGNLPEPDKGLESTTLIIEFNSEFYNAPGKLLYKGLYQAPQKIAVSKKALDPEQRIDLLKRSTEDLKQAAAERVGGGEITR
jgi:hypothetical protein